MIIKKIIDKKINDKNVSEPKGVDMKLTLNTHHYDHKLKEYLHELLVKYTSWAP